MALPRTPPDVPHGGPTYGVVPGPVRPGGPASPGWLADPAPPITERPATGRIPPGGGPEMMDTLTKVVTGLTAIGLLGFLNHWARPTLKASRLQQKNGVWGWLQSVLDNIQGFLDHGVNHIGNKVSAGAAHAAAAPAHTLDLFALRWEQVVWNLAFLAHDTADAIGQIVLHEIPHAVGTAVHPVKLEVKKLRKGVIVIVEEITTVKRYFKTVIVREIRPQIHHLTIITTKVLPLQIRKVKIELGRVEIRVKQQTTIITRLLPLLTVAGATGLVLKAFTQLRLKGLLCQNVKDFFNSLCPSPPGSGRGLGKFGGAFGRLLGDLAALSFIPFALTEACQLVHAIEVLAIKVQPEIDALVLGIEGFVCGGTSDLPSAIEAGDLKRATPLPTGL